MSNTCTCRQPQFFIPRSAFPLDEKAAYTDSVLKVLIESRFGSGYDYQLFVQPTDRPKIEPAAFCDLPDAALWPFYASSSLGRKTLKAIVSAYRKATRMGCSDTRWHEAKSLVSLAPNLGRGSP